MTYTAFAWNGEKFTPIMSGEDCRLVEARAYGLLQTRSDTLSEAVLEHWFEKKLFVTAVTCENCIFRPSCASCGHVCERFDVDEFKGKVFTYRDDPNPNEHRRGPKSLSLRCKL